MKDEWQVRLVSLQIEFVRNYIGITIFILRFQRGGSTNVTNTFNSF